MPRITEIRDFDGFDEKVHRLGLADLLGEVESVLDFDLAILEKRHANGTKPIREKIDELFSLLPGWEIQKSGGIDWRKSNQFRASIGVEVQVSGRSDLLAVDVLHLRDDFRSGVIDVGVILVPDDELSYFLTDRTPNFRTALRHIENKAEDLPIRVCGFRHNGAGAAIPKMRTNLGRV